MKYTGQMTDVTDGMFIYGGWNLSDAIATDDRIAIDWREDDCTYNIALRRRADDSDVLEGPLTMREDPTSSGYYILRRYKLADGGMILLGDWEMDGYEGMCVFELEPAE